MSCTCPRSASEHRMDCPEYEPPLTTRELKELRRLLAQQPRVEPQIGDQVQITSSEGLFTGVLVNRAIDRPLVIDAANNGDWANVPGDIEDIVVVRKGAIFE
jgi:hypothetical protein